MFVSVLISAIGNVTPEQLHELLRELAGCHSLPCRNEKPEDLSLSV